MRLHKLLKGKSGLNILAVIEPPGTLNALKDPSGYVEVVMTVDSGASETVMRKDTLEQVPIVKGAPHTRGVKYEVANGEIVDNEGERNFVAETEEGITRSLKAQVCGVNRDLLSVSKLVKNGSRVVFSSVGSYVQDEQTGQHMWLKEAGGMYTLSLWVKGNGSGF